MKQPTEKKERKPVVRRSKGQVALDSMKGVNRALKLALVVAEAEQTAAVLGLVNEAAALTVKIKEQFNVA